MSAGQPMESGRIILPTGYFPPVIYFALLAGDQPLLIEAMETYHKQTFRNRCEIMTVSGRSSLVVPVTRPFGNHTMTADIRISYREPWQRKHWRSLETSYNSSPYFIFYKEKIHALINIPEPSLILFNNLIIKGVSELLGISPKISLTEDYQRLYPGNPDFRALLSPKKGLPGFNHPSYPQVFEHQHGFIPGLSILDLLFNLGPETRRYLEKMYSLQFTVYNLKSG